LGESQPEKNEQRRRAMHRAWINLKSAVTSGDDKAILKRGRARQDSAVREFEEAMHDGLTTPLQDIVSRHSAKSKALTIASSICGMRRRRSEEVTAIGLNRHLQDRQFNAGAALLPRRSPATAGRRRVGASLL